MNKLGILIKNYIQTYLGNFGRRKNKASFIGGGALLLVMGLLFIFIFGLMTSTMILELEEKGSDPILAFYTLILMSLIFLVMIIILKGTSTKKTNDHDLLCSMPFKKSTIVLAQILKEFIFDFLAIICTLLPGIVVYVWMVPVTNSAGIVLMAILVCIFLTFLSNALSVLLKSLVFQLTKNFKAADVIKTIINVIIFIVFIFCYYFLTFKMEDVESDFMNQLFVSFPVQLLKQVIIDNSLIKLLILFLICIAPFILAVLIQVLSFDQKEKAFKSKSNELIFKKSSVTFDLIKKEVSKYFRSSVYVMNTIFGAFMMILFASIFAGNKGMERISNILTMYFKYTPDTSVMGLLVIVIIGLLSSTVCTTSSSISLEGKQFWIAKSLPIPSKKILHSKIGLNMLVGGIPAVIASLIIIISYQINFYMIPLFLIYPLLIIFSSSLIGLNNNLKWHRLDWTNETEVIKQSLAVFVSMFVCLVPAIIALGLFFILMGLINAELALLIICVIYLGFDIVLYLTSIKKGINRLDNIYA